MHCLWSSTICRQFFALSASSSTLEPNLRKQSSLRFFVSGHAQHLSTENMVSLDVLERGRKRDGRGARERTHGLSPSGLSGFKVGLADSEFVNGRRSVG